jgi:hypothetical protein
VDELEAFYRANYRPDGAQLVISSPLRRKRWPPWWKEPWKLEED